MSWGAWLEAREYVDTEAPRCRCCGAPLDDVEDDPCSPACEAELCARERGEEIRTEWAEDARRDREEGCE